MTAAREVDDSTVNLSRYQVWIRAVNFLEQHARGEREQRKNTQLCFDRETARSGLLRRWSFLQRAASGNGRPPGEVKSTAAQCQFGSQRDLGQHRQQESDFVKSKFGLLSILVTYRLNPAFSVTNLSSSSTSGEGKNKTKGPQNATTQKKGQQQQ